MPNSNTPEKFEDLKRTDPAEKAGGLKAVTNSMKHVMAQSGPLRGAAALARLNQKRGFDCPSCAWPDPDDHRSPTEFCENGAKAIASETTRRLIDRDFFAKHSVEALAAQSDYWHDQQGRIAEPLVLHEGATHYQPIDWHDAFALIGDTLKSFDDPNEAIFYTSGRASNEAAFLYQLFTRLYGTNNLPDCSNMCHESSGIALKDTIGIGKGTVSLDDIHQAELILVVGQNPGTNHPRMLSSLQIAKENGAKIVSINPLQEAGLKAFAHPQRVTQVLGGRTSIADHFICPKTNGDQAIFQGIAKYIVDKAAQNGSTIDASFISEYGSGFGRYKTHIAKVDWSEITRLSGVSQKEIENLAELIINSEKIITCWAMGLTQHRNAVATIQEVVNIHFLRGAIGKPGAGLCPVRGHSNVQGDRTMGIYEAMPESFLAKLDEVFEFKAPRKVGHHAVDAIRAMRSGEGKLFLSLGGNFLSASPDTDYTAQALQNTELTVQISTKLNRGHLITGRQALILPCLGRSETDLQKTGPQKITVENSMGVVSASEGRLTPTSNKLKSEVAIICGIARATLPKNLRVDWDAYESDYSLIRDKIEEVIPHFDNFNERVSKPGGFYLYNGAKERKFATYNAKANFTCHELDI
ncbi:MAG: FdhF/YdeP family oxidoreductase, partial [Verrucomicrobiota bacterium]